LFILLLDFFVFDLLTVCDSTHALVSMLHLWSEALHRDDSVRVLFVDYAKAFDYVNILLNKLIFSISNFIVKWIYSFLHKRNQRTKLSENLLDWITLSGGMPMAPGLHHCHSLCLFMP